MATTPDRGLFVWHEVSCKDIRSSEDFYSRLIGWKAESWDQNPSYKLFLTRRVAKAGLWAIIEQPNQVTPPPHWLSYIGTADVDSTVRQAVELGGKVVVPAYNVPNIGRMAHLQDPQGAVFAVSAQQERASYRDPEPGDFSWHELLTTNWQTAWDFYSKLFRWEKMEAMDMGPQGIYHIFGTGGNQLGGIFTPAGLPGGPMWVPYIHTRDAKRTAESAKELGATIVHGPVEVPGGWVFTAIDRQGAMFAVHSKKRVAPPITPKDTKSTAPKDTKNTTTKHTKSAKGTTTKGTKKTTSKRRT
jgi:predicted enzyme related to lactoylglutathione lyase